MTRKFFVSLVLSCLSGAALAGGMGYSTTGGTSHSKTSDETFQSLDTNNDGKLSKSEAEKAPAVQDHWSSIDKNSDGNLDKSEFSAFETRRIDSGMGSESGTDSNRPVNPGSGMQ